MTHPVLAEEGRHNFATGRLERDAECLVLDVGTQTASVDLDGRLHTKTQDAEAGSRHLSELTTSWQYPVPLANRLNTAVEMGKQRN